MMNPQDKSTAAPGPHSGLGDLWGGLAAMLVALPSAIAFGVVIFSAVSPSLAGAGALAGIIGAAALGIVAPLVGRNGGFITAPCAPAAAVMAGLAAHLAARHELSQDQVLGLLAITALLSAALQFVYGALRAGRLIKFIPYQVVSGYMSGVAVIIAVAQFPKLLGVPKGTHLGEALISPLLWKWPGIVVGLVTIAAMVIAPKLTKKVPGAIVGLTCGIVAYFALGLLLPELLQLDGNAHVIGRIAASGSFLSAVSVRLSSVVHFDPASLPLVIGPALTLSALLSIDTLKTGVVLDALTRRRHNSNRELIGQGVANAVSFAAGGMPGAGTMGATLVNVSSGGRSLWSGVIEGSLALAAFLVLGPLIAWVPIGALAGILLVIAWRMFDFSMFRLLLLKSARFDFFVIAAVIVVAEGVGLIQASLVGVFLAILLFIRDQIRASVILRKVDLRELRSMRRRLPEPMALLAEHGDQAMVVQLQGDLFFGTTDQLFSELEADLNHRRFLLFDLRRVQSMDYTAVHLFEQMHQRLHERHGDLLFSGMPSGVSARQDIHDYMVQLGLIGGAEGAGVFETRDSALEWMEERILEAAGWSAPESRPPLALHEIGLMGGFSPETLQRLAASLRELAVPAGGRIFARDEPGDEMFFVRKGRVHIRLPLEGGKHHHLATIGRGDFLGEMAFLDRGTRSADAVAASDTELFVLSRATLEELAKEDAALGMGMFEHLARGIAQRLRVTDVELRALEER
jgi:SulP family sulfate permease